MHVLYESAASTYKTLRNPTLSLILLHFIDNILRIWSTKVIVEKILTSILSEKLVMCTELILLLIIQGKLYWMCLENL
jgi:hypothetical protein